MPNDLREETGANYYFGELKMWNDGGRKKENVGIVVEAKANEILFRNFFQNDTFFVCVQGYVKVANILAECQKYKVEGIIGIIDGDFRRIEGKVPTIENLFLVDYHDTEIMMIESEAWESVLNQYADDSTPIKGLSKLKSFEEKTGKSIKVILYELASEIACLRLFSERESANLVFRIQKKSKYDYIDYRKFVDDKSLKLDQEELIKVVENKSSKRGFFQIEENKNKLIAIQQETFDALEFCNGHDVVNLFSLSLEKAIGNFSSSKKVSGEEIEKALMTAYRLTDFQKTNLYQDLKEWETNNSPPYILFK